MRVFVTGSTGYVGSAIVRALVKAGHHVGGLYRNPAKEDEVKALGATPIFGHLRDPETYQHFAAECDAVIHTAFESQDTEGAVAETLLSALIAEGENKSLVFTSGFWVLGATGDKTVDESGSTDTPFPSVTWRAALERYVVNGGNEQIATAIVRPGIVYGGQGGLFASYFNSAVKEGATVYVGDGANHTATIHRDDLAQLYLKIVEKRARGIFHGVDGQAPTIREIATAYSRAAGRNGATHSWPVSEAMLQIGPWIEALTLDQRVIARRSTELGWKPAHPSILEAADAAFAEWKATDAGSAR